MPPRSRILRRRSGLRRNVGALLDCDFAPRHNKLRFPLDPTSSDLSVTTVMSFLPEAPIAAAQRELAGDMKTIVLWVAGLAMVTAVCWYLIGKLRGSYRESDLEPSNLMSNFRDLHSQGELTDEEYRNIKAKLATQLQEWTAKTEKEAEVDET